MTEFDTPHLANCDIDPPPHLCSCIKLTISKQISEAETRGMKQSQLEAVGYVCQSCSVVYPPSHKHICKGNHSSAKASSDMPECCLNCFLCKTYQSRSEGTN